MNIKMYLLPLVGWAKDPYDPLRLLEKGLTEYGNVLIQPGHLRYL